MKRRTLKIIGIVLLIVVAMVFTFAKVERISPLSWSSKQVNQPMFSNEAINGYDAVAYISENKAVAGSEDFSVNWNNADWYFSNKENQKLFEEDPAKYAPKYGGYCAYAVGKGFTANTDPNSFEIIDGKLYLFADDKVKAEWLSSQQENIKIADRNWK